MAHELTDEEFEAVLADKRHKELLQVLKGVTTAVEKNGSNNDLLVFLQQNAEAVKDLSLAVSEIKNVPAASGDGMDRVYGVLNSLIDNMKQQLSGIRVVAEQKPQQWEFEIQRNINGFIQSVTAKSKNNA